MTLEGALLTALYVLLMMNIPVTMILAGAAAIRPRIQALTVMAVVSALVSIGILAYVVAVANTSLGFPVPVASMRVVLRIALVGLGLFPIWFLWLFFTGRFRDS